jgi:hypothetical protein
VQPVALGKGSRLPRAWPDWLSAKSFLKKEKYFAESLASKTLGRDFF